MGDGPTENPPRPSSLPESHESQGEETRPTPAQPDFDSFQLINMSGAHTLPDRNAAPRPVVGVIPDTPSNRAALTEQRANDDEPTVSMSSVDEGNLAKKFNQPPTTIRLQDDPNRTQPINNSYTTTVLPPPGSDLPPARAGTPEGTVNAILTAKHDYTGTGNTTHGINAVIHELTRRLRPLTNRRPR